MLFENTPRPSNAIPSDSRTVLCAPSAATRYCVRISRVAPPSTSATVTVTPSASCAKPTTSLPSMTSAPTSFARLRKIGSRPRWLMNRRRQGLSVSSTPTLSPGMMSASFRPAKVSMLMIAPSGRNSLSDCDFTSSSMPAARNSSIVRRWKWAARGNGDPPRSLSTTSDGTPCCARNIAVDSPTSPPPEMTTGCSPRLSLVTPRRIARSHQPRRRAARRAPCALHRG